MTIKDANELPKLLAQLKASRFYGNIHITFRAGEVSRLVTEQSQIFQTERNSYDNNEPHNSNR